jgi:hypothetical protein
MEFDLNISPPTVTAQEHKIRIVHGRPVFYDTQKLKAARSVFGSLLRQHAPEKPMDGPVALTVEWRFATKTHKEGTYRVTRRSARSPSRMTRSSPGCICNRAGTRGRFGTAGTVLWSRIRGTSRTVPGFPGSRVPKRPRIPWEFFSGRHKKKKNKKIRKLPPNEPE